jgi:xylulokinase
MSKSDEMKYIMGVDLGTSGCKAIVFDLKGRALTYSYRAYSAKKVYREHEQNPEEWWEAVCHCIRDAIKRASISLKNVIGIGLTSQSNGLICIDDEGKILRPAMIYSDSRAIKEVTELTGQIECFYKDVPDFLNLGLVSPGKIPPRVLWLRKNEPNVIRKTYKFLDAKGFIAYKLTGKSGIDIYTAWISGLADPIKKTWIEGVLDVINLSLEKFGKLCEPTEVIGELSKDGARQTGLKEGLPVIIGVWDGMSSMIGSGLINPGETMDVTGTTEIVATIVDRRLDKRVCIPYFEDEKYFLYASTRATGDSIAWFKNEFISLKETEGIVTNAFNLMENEAKKADIGSKNLIFLPFLDGLMTPSIIDEFAKGAFIGITLKHRRSEFIRAMLEGISFYLKMVFDEWEERGINILEPVIVSGGGSKNKTWNQIKADITKKKFVTTSIHETGCLGAAILASIGINEYKDIKEATQHMVHLRNTFIPNEENSRVYAKYYKLYKKAYFQLREVFKELN